MGAVLVFEDLTAQRQLAAGAAQRRAAPAPHPGGGPHRRRDQEPARLDQRVHGAHRRALRRRHLPQPVLVRGRPRRAPARPDLRQARRPRERRATTSARPWTCAQVAEECLAELGAQVLPAGRQRGAPAHLHRRVDPEARHRQPLSRGHVAPGPRRPRHAQEGHVVPDLVPPAQDAGPGGQDLGVDLPPGQRGSRAPHRRLAQRRGPGRGAAGASSIRSRSSRRTSSTWGRASASASSRAREAGSRPNRAAARSASPRRCRHRGSHERPSAGTGGRRRDGTARVPAHDPQAALRDRHRGQRRGRAQDARHVPPRPDLHGHQDAADGRHRAPAAHQGHRPEHRGGDDHRLRLARDGEERPHPRRLRVPDQAVQPAGPGGDRRAGARAPAGPSSARATSSRPSSRRCARSPPRPAAWRRRPGASRPSSPSASPSSRSCARSPASLLGQLDFRQLTAAHHRRSSRTPSATTRRRCGSARPRPRKRPGRPGIVCPIREEGNILGYLLVANRSATRPIDPGERELLEMLSDYLAVAIRNSRLYGEVAETKQYLEQLILSAGDAIISVDGEGQVRSWNPAAERIFGFTAAQAVGQPFANLLPQEPYRAARASPLARESGAGLRRLRQAGGRAAAEPGRHALLPARAQRRHRRACSPSSAT